MNRSCKTWWLIPALALAACGEESEVGGETVEAIATSPNIVLILADDLGWGDPGCYNADSKIPTPNIDRIAKEGMRLTDAHSPSGVCSPTRFGIITGNYAWRSPMKKGVLGGDSPALIPKGMETVASVLKDAGYRTACFGKWHLGMGRGPVADFTQPLDPSPLDYGFDAFYGIPASLDQPPYLWVDGNEAVEPPKEPVEFTTLRRLGGPGFIRDGLKAPGFEHAEALPTITDKAVRWLDGQDGTEPFFLYFPLTAPHTPWLPNAPWAGSTEVGPYGDFVAQIDSVVGEVLDVLDRKGFADNTLVIFTSDNGSHWMPMDIEEHGHRANADWRGMKADIHEGGHRVPFLARWPGHVPAGSVRDDLVGLQDLFATFADVAGKPRSMFDKTDSLSVRAVLEGQELSEPVRNTMVLHSFEGMFAYREGDWKVIFGLGSGGFTEPAFVRPKAGQAPGQLYDLAADPGETENLWGRMPFVVTSLRGALEEVQRGPGR